MKKENLLKRCESYKQSAELRDLINYNRGRQKAVAFLATLIIETICEQKDITPILAKESLKMVAEIIDGTAEHEVIQ